MHIHIIRVQTNIPRGENMNTIPQRASRTVDYELEEDESYYIQRQPTSTRRYYDRQGNQVIQQGNKRLVIHQQPPPSTRKLHWSLILGTGMILMLALWVLGSSVLAWWQNHQLDSIYGMPRTFQADAVVYPSD